MTESARMAEWQVVHKSLAYFTCSPVMPSFFRVGLFSGEGKINLDISSSGTGDDERGSTKARPRSRITASTNASVFCLRGTNSGQSLSPSVDSVMALRSRAAKTLYPSMRAARDSKLFGSCTEKIRFKGRVR